MLPGLAFQAPRWEVMKHGRCEIEESLGDLSIGIRRVSAHLAISAPNSCLGQRIKISYRSILNPIFTVTWNSCTLSSAMLPRCSTTSNHFM